MYVCMCSYMMCEWTSLFLESSAALRAALIPSSHRLKICMCVA